MDPDIVELCIDTLSSDNEALKISSLIVHYLSKNFLVEYKWSDIENLMKIFVMLCETISRNGPYQLDQLPKDDQWFLQHTFKIIFDEQNNCANFDVMLKNIVLKSENSLKCAIILDHIINYINKYFNYNIQLETFSPDVIRNTSVNINRKKLYAIIERVFILPCSDIENAIDTLIATIDFEILGHVFCETSNSIYFDKCTIVSDIICNKINTSSDCAINAFMPSIVFALKSKNGISLFKECLQNQQFCFSLNVFLKTYLKNFENCLTSTRDRNMYSSYCQMSYVMYINCNEIHNRYLDIFTDLNENKFIQDYLTSINVIFS